VDNESLEIYKKNQVKKNGGFNKIILI